MRLIPYALTVWSNTSGAMEHSGGKNRKHSSEERERDWKQEMKIKQATPSSFYIGVVEIKYFYLRVLDSIDFCV